MMMEIPPESIASRYSFLEIKSHEEESVKPEYYRKLKIKLYLVA